MAMDPQKAYEILYTETAIQDMEEKTDYIACQFQDASLSLKWYLRLRDAIQENLSTMPLKYPLYPVEPWARKGIRQFLFRKDVVLYSVEESRARVYIRAVCTRGMDLSAHMAGEQPIE